MKKILKNVFRETSLINIAFSSTIVKKDKLKTNNQRSPEKCLFTKQYWLYGQWKTEKKLHLSYNGKAAFAKNVMGYMNRVDWGVFPCDGTVNDDECFSDTLGDADSDVNITLKSFFKSNKDKIIFPNVNINIII